VSTPKAHGLWGLLAEFHTPHGIVEAARAARAKGYEKIDAYTPFPIEELIHEVSPHPSKVPLIVLIGGMIGAIGGFGLCYWASVIEYPMNIGGRPYNSWPAFIPITFECTILLAGISAVVGMIAVNGLPQPYHPVFNVPGFALASRDRYFLSIEADDPRFDREATAEFLRGLDASEVSEVEQ
jgi:hypothetical protein